MPRGKNCYKVTELQKAVSNSSVEQIKKLLDAGTEDIDALDDKGRTALHRAILRKRISFCYDEIDFTISLCTPKKKRPSSNALEIVELLLNKGANINVLDNDQKSPLSFAVLSKDKDILNTVLMRGANINFHDRNGVTPLHIALKTKFDYGVNKLLEQRAEVNVKDSYGRTPLHYAVLSYEKKYVMQMLRVPATDLYLRDNNGQTALHLGLTCARSMMFHGYDSAISISQFLIKSGSNVNVPDNYGNRPIHLAAESLSIPTCELLLEKGAEVNVVNNNHETPLFVTIKRQPHIMSMTRLFLSYNADINIADKNENTPLHEAAIDDQLADLLICNGANINAKNKFDETPLVRLLKIRANDSDASGGLHLLLCLKSDINLKDNAHRTALHYAAKCENAYVVQLMVSNGRGDVNCKDKQGWTPLHFAIFNDERDAYDIIDILLKKGAYIDAENDDGNTPLDLAIRYSQSSYVVSLLFKWGADLNMIKNYDIFLENVEKWSCFTDHVEKLQCAELTQEMDVELNMAIGSDVSWRQSCHYELELLKERKVGKYSFYDVLHYRSDMSFLSCVDLEQKIQSIDVEDDLFIYGGMLRTLFQKAKARKNLLQNAEMCFDINLPNVIIRQVLRYLSNYDLKHILKIYMDSNSIENLVGC